MSNIIHTACPRCRERGDDRSGDNLAIYADGHKYCFKCGYFETSRIIKKGEAPKYKAVLPNDLNWEIPTEIKKWLFKYVTLEDLIKFRIGYSPYWNQIIIPIGLNAFIARNFDKEKPKWYFKGDKPKDYIIGNSDTVIVCEDMLSGIRLVNAGFSAHVLFGTNISFPDVLKPYKRFSKVRIWLDRDAQSKSLKNVLKLKTIITDVRTISTEHDPKEYSIDEIRSIINGPN